MRVIAGTYRSRPLSAPKGLRTRPTSDRLRETLFNVIAPRLPGCVFADLFAGSGAVGIEALSRGARLVYFVENAAPALAAIRANLEALKIRSGYVLEQRSALAALRRLATVPDACDVIFLDPPYEPTETYAATLAAISGSPVLAAEGIVVAEHRRNMPAPLAESFGNLQRYRVLDQGDAALSFYRRSADEEPSCSR